MTKFKKVAILVQAIERRIVAENSCAPLKKLCQVLRRHHGVGMQHCIEDEISARLVDHMIAHWLIIFELLSITSP